MAEKEIITEEELLRRLRDPQKKRAAFDLATHLFGRNIYWHIRRIVYNHDDASDLLQNTFLKAWIAIDDFRGDSKVSTWLYRIAVHEALAFIKKRKKQSERRVDITETNSYLLEQHEGPSHFDGDETERKFQKALETLPPKQRLVFNLRYYDEMPYAEISAVTGTSEGALKASYHHAARKIEKLLVPDD